MGFSGSSSMYAWPSSPLAGFSTQWGITAPSAGWLLIKSEKAKSVDPPFCIVHLIGGGGPAVLAFPILINDQPAELPVIHVVAKNPASGEEGHAYILDDPENPMLLAVVGKTGHAQFTKIYWDFPKRTGLEEELTENGRAKVYDLYFDFRSGVLRPDSDKVLKEIAQVMGQHPDWKLAVEGHTH